MDDFIKDAKIIFFQLEATWPTCAIPEVLSILSVDKETLMPPTCR